MRLFTLSDIHADFLPNMRMVAGISDCEYRDDALIIAGDVSHDMNILSQTLSLLKKKFAEVFFTPGNHELWVDRGTCLSSLEKFEMVIELCQKLGVITHAYDLGFCQIVPLFSWYESAFSTMDTNQDDELDGWADRYLCHWHLDDARQAIDTFLNMNLIAMATKYHAPVITFSHFLPRQELLPSVDHLTFKGLPLVAGSVRLDQQIRSIGSGVHVFGHSHINIDLTIDGVRYIQNALGYPKSVNPDKQLILKAI